MLIIAISLTIHAVGLTKTFETSNSLDQCWSLCSLVYELCNAGAAMTNPASYAELGDNYWDAVLECIDDFMNCSTSVRLK
jgi:hypothetical protein